MAETVQLREGLAVEIGPLTTAEALKADTIVGSILGDNPTTGGLALLTTKVYSLCAVRKINDLIMQPLAGGAQFDAVCSKFDLNDLTQLMVAYDQKFGVKVQDLKNDSSAEASETSQD